APGTTAPEPSALALVDGDGPFPARENDGAHDGHYQQSRRELEGQQVVGEQRAGQPLDVRLVPARERAGGRPSPAGPLEADEEEQLRERGDADERSEWTLASQWLDGQALGTVDTDEHDHEEEEHDDGAGVDDHLHGGEEV